nr:glycosyltransferase family 2 protein [Caenimonas aquaedulcis]
MRASASVRRRAPASPLDKPEVTVVILNRNGAEVLDSMLESWTRYSSTVAAEIIVIDHASEDDSLRMLKRWESGLDLRVVALDHNASFSASCNRGAKLARADTLFFLNNDIIWLHDGLPRLLESLRDERVGIVGMKLIKEVGESRHALQPANEVQHLGIRFKLHNGGYWPYEVAPSPLRADQEHSPQAVPAVTGAAMLCRKSDFEAVGGFDPAYFYGYEDVEFCLRLSQRLGKLVVSRNDVCALHRHGHTRLSGRDMSIVDRVQANASVLASQTALWTKQAYWRSLLQGDGFITNEPFTLGVVADPSPGDEMQQLAAQILSEFPHARVVFFQPGSNWKDAGDIHVLIVGSHDYDIRSLHGARADLLTLAWIRDKPARWKDAPWWQDFGGSFGRGQSSVNFAGGLLDRTRWRLRVAIHVPLGAEEVAGTSELAEVARALRLSLSEAGSPCWVVPLEHWSDDAVMADVCITLCALQKSGSGPVPSLASDTLNVMWLVQEGSSIPESASKAKCLVTREAPTYEWLQEAMRDRIGRTFHPS